MEFPLDVGECDTGCLRHADHKFDTGQEIPITAAFLRDIATL